MIDNVILGQFIDPDWGNDVADAINPSAWTAPTLGSSWLQFGSGEQDVQYRKINELVYLRGSMRAGVVNNVAIAFTLPALHRPPRDLWIAVASNNAFGQVRIRSDGGLGVTNGSNVSVRLDNIVFSTTA